MKNEVMFKRVLSLIIVAVIAFFCTATVFAVDLDGDGIDDDEPVYTEAPTEYVEPEPEYTEAPTEYVEPEPVYTEAPTEYVEPVPVYTEEPTEYVELEPEPIYTEAPTQYVEQAPVVQETTEFQAPTLAKTISDKQYSTNYTAGIISWICVAVGVIVVVAVLISTKLSGKKG